jgi:hypothetical protein
VKVGKRTAKLLREAMVLAYVEGSRWGQCHPDCHGEASFPTDSQIVQQVVVASVAFRDLYPTLSRIDDAQSADVQRRRRELELLTVMMDRARDSDGDGGVK